MRNYHFLLVVIALAFSLPTHINPAFANQFVQNYVGKWCGPGEIVAGKYAETRFTCEIELTAAAGKKALNLTGTCRVGVFPKPMEAVIDLSRNAIRGAFFPNSPADRLEITGGKIGNRQSNFIIKRDQINGNVALQLSGKGRMKSTVSVRAGLEMVPVISMSFKRCDR